MEVGIHAELQHRSTRCLRGQLLSVWSYVRTPVVATVVQTRIVDGCSLDDRVDRHHHGDTVACFRGRRAALQSRWLTGATT